MSVASASARALDDPLIRVAGDRLGLPHPELARR
jgi:hypothetical protein